MALLPPRIRWWPRASASPASLLGFILALTCTPQLWAHGSVHEQILAVSKEIAHSPRQTNLYLRRGELYFYHSNWDAALADYDTAASFDDQLAIVDLYRGKTLLAANRLESGRHFLDRFLAGEPKHPDGLLTRARLLAKMQEYRRAVQDYNDFIEIHETPRPEYFLERAQAQVQMGPEYIVAALCGIDDGMGVLGAVVTMQLYAIDLEVRLERHNAAIARLEKVAAQSARKEKWLFRKGEILMLAGQHEAAKAAYTEALARIESLAPRRRRNKATANLERKIRRTLSQFASGEI